MHYNFPNPIWMDAAFWICILGVSVWMFYFLHIFRQDERGEAAMYPSLTQEIDAELFEPPCAAIHPDFELLSRQEQLRRFGRILYYWQLEIGTFLILNDISGSFRMREITEVMEIRHDDEGFRDAVGMWRMRVRTVGADTTERIYKLHSDGHWQQV